MKLLATLLLFLVCTLPAVAGLTPTQKKAEKATHRISEKSIAGKAACSATSVGPHALLTASHCEIPTWTIYVDGTAATIDGLTRDDFDHTIYVLKDITFDDYVAIDTTPFAVGDDVFMFGNPGQLTGLFRKGYVTSYRLPSLSEALSAALSGAELPPPVVFFDFTGWHGDSGAAVFNSKGAVQGVVSFSFTQSISGEPLDAMRLMGGYPLAFSPAAIKQAREYKPATPANK